jgi:hypothetical protein
MTGLFRRLQEIVAPRRPVRNPAGVKRPKKVSQTQLARELGISQALVSLVLNGRKQGISTETYDRIWAHAVKRGYHPKGMHLASSPAAKARQVGIILRAPLRLNTPSMYFGHVQHGLHTGIEAREFTTVFLGAEDQLDTEKLRRVFGPGHSFRGIVIVGEVTRRFLDQLRQFGCASWPCRPATPACATPSWATNRRRSNRLSNTCTSSDTAASAGSAAMSASAGTSHACRPSKPRSRAPASSSIRVTP